MIKMPQGTEEVGVRGQLGFRACWESPAPGPVSILATAQVCHHNGFLKVLRTRKSQSLGVRVIGVDFATERISI